VSIKIKVSYTTDEEIKLVTERLRPITDSVKLVKGKTGGEYKRAYFFKDDSKKLDTAAHKG